MQPQGSSQIGTAPRPSPDTSPSTAKRPRVRSRESVVARPFWPGLWGAALCVIIISGLLALMVWRLGPPAPVTSPAGATHSTPTSTPSSQPTASPTSPTPLTVIPPVSLAQAWGAHAALTAFTTQIPNSANVFQATAIMPNGSALLGYLISPGPGGHTASAQAGMLTIATKQFTALGVPASDGANPPACCLTDGRYLVANDAAQPSAIHYWSYDLQTGQSRLVANGAPYGAINAAFVDHGMMLFQTQTQGWLIANLATGTIAPPAYPIQPPGVMAFAWPYVITSGVAAGSVYPNALNLQTGATISLASVTGPLAIANGKASVAITGDTYLFASSTDNATLRLGQIQHFTAPNPQAATVGVFPSNQGEILAANDRIIAFKNSPIVWDRLEQRLVLTSTAPNAFTALAGHDLLVVEPAASPWLPERVTIYDTSALPTAGQ